MSRKALAAAAIAAAMMTCVCGLHAVETRPTKPRLIVTTDIGGDPDDQQSMIRLMVHSSEFEIEGLIASACGVPGELNRDVVQPELIRQIVEAYGQVRPNLIEHDPAFPPADVLLARIKSGNPQRGVKNVGDGKDTEGSNWIIAVADRPDARPVHVAIWGGSTELAQALWRVRHDRAAEGLQAFLGRLRVYAVGQQDDTGPWILENFPALFYVLGNAPEGRDKREAVYRGMYLGGDESLTSLAWLDTHVRTGHGPLGALYPPKTWTAPNPHAALKEGDTPSWFYCLPNGLQDPEHPEWGGWGGRFGHTTGGLYRDAADEVNGQRHTRAAVWRWRPAYQNEFQARMDWCIRPRVQANHKPVAALNGDTSRRILEVRVDAGSAVALSAAGSSDPDGHAMGHRWWIYGEAGTYRGSVVIQDADRAEATLRVPADAAGKTIHVILEVTDRGDPPLTAYRRAVLGVR